MTEYIYAIERCGLVKIGRSVDPDRRMKSLSAVRFRPQLLAKRAVENAKADERLLHWIFRFQLASPLSSEWFKVTPEQAKWAIENIQLIRSSNEVPAEFSLLRFWRSCR